MSFEMDWDVFLTEGLLPVSRVHFKVIEAKLKEGVNEETLEPWKAINVEFLIDRHEELGPLTTDGEGPNPERHWEMYFMRGKSAERFRSLYHGLTGRKLQPTSRDPETGKPKVNFEAICSELNGLDAWTAWVWRKNKKSEEIEGGFGWNYAKKIEDIKKPVNKFLATASNATDEESFGADEDEEEE